MRPGRETDARVAQEIFEYVVWSKNNVLFEKSEEGERPLRPYSRDMIFAWDIAEKMRISVLPIEGEQWFAFAGGSRGWPSPQDFLKYLDAGDFADCGAAVCDSAAAAICEAALKVMDKRKQRETDAILTLVRDDPTLDGPDLPR